MAFDVGNDFLNKQLCQWLEWDKNEKTRKEILDLAECKNTDELHKLFDKRIAFGTAGLRAAMGAGFSRMNDLTIIQTTQGLVKHLLEAIPDGSSRGVVVGFDSRYNSPRYAELAASILLREGVKVYLFSAIVPTPYVPYTVRKYKCAAGIMVTASHNPKDDNGYKVYWQNGAQITSPTDKNIATHIEANLEPWQNSWDTSIISTSPLLQHPLDEINNLYMLDVQKYCIYRDINKSSQVRFTYTPMHGVGLQYAQRAFKSFDLSPFVAVKEQSSPDPDFPTVKFPNPEEGKSALNLAMKTAEENNCSIILANDPDADRIAMAEWNKVDHSWKVFTGNETGALLGWWAFHCYQHQRQNNQQWESVYMLASTVSSKILRAIGKKEGFKFEETLTGFKWMGNRSHQLQEKGHTVLFAFEEAIGFMYGSNVLDKDGISACAILAEMAGYLATQGMTMKEKLYDIYKKYGFHYSINSYYICHHQPTIQNMFDTIRTMENGSYPSACGEFKITGTRDLTTGFDSNQPDNKAILPTSKSSQMITFTFENGAVATLRTSGTEPKIKYYTEICADPSLSDYEALKEELRHLVQNLIDNFLQPNKNNLQSNV
ncbi:phosphoglucomutase-2-like isoform X2 [Anneissia japonica]|uniref:phosphoglucomutase-2-like isoform X2 n=1 Tax=Anneissia japonica TaxID=1529436 RepID=UPI00142592B2|nr:phosphoglucomutase-2-like isoform X2 [Anneissia japonica]